MENHQCYLFCMLLLFTWGTSAQDCYNAPTSEGLVSLQEGQFACAALLDDQKLEDVGKNYIVCSHGKVLMMPCPPKLRWDTSISGCNTPENANCNLQTVDRSYTVPPAESTSVIIRTTGTRQRDSTRTSQQTASATVSPNERPTFAFDKTTSAGEAAQGNQCVNVATSEGLRTLQHGQKACAPLGAGESNSDLGKKFITCSFGSVFTQQCQTGLRYDTSSESCNWPGLATCALPGGNPPNVVSTPATKPVPITTSSSQERSTTTRLPISQTTFRQYTVPTRTPQPPPPGPCNDSNCKRPNCFCFGASPSTIPLADTPMFVVLTFDDALTTLLYDSYFRAMVVDNDFRLFNPNGCRTKSTFYVSHENTDYTKVKAIWEAGNEIGSHTIHHRLPWGDKDSDYQEMVAEIQGLKDEMLRATGNKTLVDTVTGFRAPYLRVAGDVMYDVLRDYGMQYDSSILNINILQGKDPHWPYTLDFVVGECINPPCPTKPYPGLFEIPLNGWIGDDREGCSMVDACVVGRSPWSATVQEWYNFFNRNFLSYFYPVKVPMPIFTHGFLFTNYPNSYPALMSWLQDVLLTRKDVWLVTPQQVISWMQNPLSNKEMIAQKWGC